MGDQSSPAHSLQGEVGVQSRNDIFLYVTRTMNYIFKRVYTLCGNVSTQKYMVTVQLCGEIHLEIYSRKYEY